MKKTIIVESIIRLKKRLFNARNAEKNLNKVAKLFNQSDKRRILHVPSAHQNLVLDLHNDYKQLNEHEFATRMASLQGNILDSIYAQLKIDVFSDPWVPESFEIEVGSRQSKDGLLGLLAAKRSNETGLWIPENPVLIHKWQHMVPQPSLRHKDRVIVSPVGTMGIAVYSTHHKRGAYLSISPLATLYQLKEAIAVKFGIEFENQLLVIDDLVEVKRSDNINDSSWYNHSLLRLGIGPRNGLSDSLEDAQVRVNIKAATDQRMDTTTVGMDVDDSVASGSRNLSLESDIPIGDKSGDSKSNNNQGKSSGGPQDADVLLKNIKEDEQLCSLLQVKPQSLLGCSFSLKPTDVKAHNPKSVAKFKSSKGKKSTSSNVGRPMKRKRACKKSTSSNVGHPMKRKRSEGAWTSQKGSCSEGSGSMGIP